MEEPYAKARTAPACPAPANRSGDTPVRHRITWRVVHRRLPGWVGPASGGSGSVGVRSRSWSYYRWRKHLDLAVGVHIAPALRSTSGWRPICWDARGVVAPVAVSR